jgi:hypothetical protein
MFMHDSFSSAPFMALFVTTPVFAHGEEYRFSFIIDQSLPLTFTIDQQFTFNW